MTTRHCTTLIVGGGIAGLTTALRILTQHPHEKVVVLEKYGKLGGRAMTYTTDISGVGAVQWENGAGRIHSSHTHLHSLIAKYGLHTAPLPDTANFLLGEGATPGRDRFEDLLPTMLLPFEELPADTLAASTLWELAGKLYGRKVAARFFQQFPYYTEVRCLRADLALETFRGEMGDRGNFGVLKEGFSALVEKIAADVSRWGGELLTRHTLKSFEEVAGPAKERITATVEVTEPDKPARQITITADRIILALHAEALRPLKAIRTWAPLKHLGSARLLRIYAVFPKGPSGRVWFADMPRTITPTPLRYVIPINPEQGTIMISYTDGADAEPWFGLADTGPHPAPILQQKIMAEVRALFGSEIPDPIFLKAHPWTVGTTYWKPGAYDAHAMSVAAHRITPRIFVVGEAISTRQAWIEGALESVETLMGLQEFTSATGRPAGKN